MPEDKTDLTYAAPLICIDLPAINECSNEPYEIYPCNDCLPWYLEVITDHDTLGTATREWHAAECPTLLRGIHSIRGDGDGTNS